MKITSYTVIGEHGDSKAEFDFVWELRKHTSAEIIWQYPVNPYRLDFLVKGSGISVGIELDGKEWHDIERDSVRDKNILLKDNSIDKIVRFEGHDAVYNASFCVRFLAINLPELFLVPEKSDKRFYTAREVSEREDKLEVSTDHITKGYDSKLRLHGVHDIQYSGATDRYGYSEHEFKIEFMTPKIEKRYLYDDEVKNGVDPLEYTHAKTSKVLVMERS